MMCNMVPRMNSPRKTYPMYSQSPRFDILCGITGIAASLTLGWLYYYRERFVALGKPWMPVIALTIEFLRLRFRDKYFPSVQRSCSLPFAVAPRARLIQA